MAAIDPQDGPVVPGGVPPAPAPPVGDDADETQPNAPAKPQFSVDADAAKLSMEVNLDLGKDQTPLDEAAFRERYLAAIREAQQRYRTLRPTPPPAANAAQPAAAAGPAPADGNAAAGAAAAANGAPQDGQQQLALWDLVGGLAVAPLVVGVLKIAFAAFLFGRSNFWTWFGVITAFKVASLLFTRVKFRSGRDTRRYVHPDDEYFSDDDDNRDLARRAANDIDAQADLVQRRRAFNAGLQQRRRQLLVRKALKCVTTFFVSIFPSWRIENLHAELIRDGLMRDESKRRREPRPEPQQQQQREVAAAAAADGEEERADDAAAEA